MQRRDFYFLLPTGIALIAAVVIELTLSGRGPIPSAAPTPVFPGLANRLGEIAWVRVLRGATKVDFANVAGRWVLVEKDNYPADPARLQHLFSALAGLTLIEPGRPGSDRSAGIDGDGAAGDAPTLIALRGRAGDTVAEAIVTPAPDKAAAGGGAVYVRKPGVELASLARGTVELPGDPLGWLDRTIIDLPRTRIASLRLTGPDGVALTIGRDGPDTDFKVAALPQGVRLRPDAGLSDLAGALAGLSFDDVKPRPLVEIPESGIVRAGFATFDGIAIDLRLFAYQGADWVAVAVSGTGAAEEEGKALNDRLARWVYAIPASRAKLLRTRLDDLTEPAKGL